MGCVKPRIIYLIFFKPKTMSKETTDDAKLLGQFIKRLESSFPNEEKEKIYHVADNLVSLVGKHTWILVNEMDEKWRKDNARHGVYY